jgi:type IV pilus assembly protein PilC
MQSGFEPPTFSRIVFSIGLFFGQYGLLFLVFFALLIGGGFFFYQRNIGFKKFVSSIINEIPAVKDIIKKISIQRFAATLSSLIKAGLPMMRALEITADAGGRIELKEALQRVANDGIAKGLTLGEAFKKEKYFPRTVSSLMAISEKAGHIEEVLITLSEFYGSEIDSALKVLVSFLEPVLLLFIGAIIGLLHFLLLLRFINLLLRFKYKNENEFYVEKRLYAY